MANLFIMYKLIHWIFQTKYKITSYLNLLLFDTLQ